VRMYYLRFIIYDLRIHGAALVLIFAALGIALGGCNAKTWDPSQIGRFRPTPAVNVILDSLGVAEESPVAWENAQEPQPNDIVAVKKDYALRPGDVVRISIFELYQEGVVVVNDYTVSETGRISVPDVGVIQASGLTERQLEDEVKRILSPNVLRNPSVTVTLLDSQQRTFSILGNAVARPSRYVIPRYDFRLTDALATAQTQMQFNVSNIYVSRKEETTTPSTGPALPKQAPELDLLEPGSSSKLEGRGPTMPDRGPRTAGGGRAAYPSPVLRPPSSEIPEPSEPAQRFESEREMLDLIAPQANTAWPRSEKLAGGSSRSRGLGDVTASVMPDGRRDYPDPVSPGPGLRVSFQVRGQDRLPVVRGSEVVSPVEFGTANTGLETPSPVPPPPAPKAKERTEWVFRGDKWVPITVTDQSGYPAQVPAWNEKPAAQTTPGAIEWTFRDDKWVPVPKGTTPIVKPPAAAAPARPSGREKLPMEAEWEQAIQTRLIRIPADKLLAGDPRYNIIIKPGDTIHVPVDIIGEFAIMGNVNRSGYIDITGRPMTLKMAIAAAGGLGPLASPKNVEVIRRIGTAREEIVMVNLDKIASGEQPDFFIKPNDLINVGTDLTARWRAVLRNAFRAVYGFGFVYDRNFADIDYGTGFPWFHNF
jgi:protein involved in polysaccharide export with SLBB domain